MDEYNCNMSLVDQFEEKINKLVRAIEKTKELNFMGSEQLTELVESERLLNLAIVGFSQIAKHQNIWTMNGSLKLGHKVILCANLEQITQLMKQCIGGTWYTTVIDISLITQIAAVIAKTTTFISERIGQYVPMEFPSLDGIGF
jgi:hypothetical protein